MSNFIDVEHEQVAPLRRAPLRIFDRHGELAYEARMERGSGMSALIGTARGDVVASVHQRRFSQRIWEVELDGKNFEIRRERFCFVPRSEVFGGPWHVATTRGNIFGCIRFELEHRGCVLARASSFPVAGRGVHRVDMPSNRDQDEHFIVATILTLRLQSDIDYDR